MYTVVSDAYQTDLLLPITLAGPPWIAVSFREHRNARNSHGGHEKVHPESTG